MRGGWKILEYEGRMENIRKSVFDIHKNHLLFGANSQ
jgi:hypothetical protein